MAKSKKPPEPLEVGAITHPDDKRRNIPTAEMQPIVRDEHTLPIPVIYERRNRDLDPQLVWRGKDEQDQNPLVVPTMPLFIQEKIHPKVLIEDLVRQSKENKGPAPAPRPPGSWGRRRLFGRCAADAGSAEIVEELTIGRQNDRGIPAL